MDAVTQKALLQVHPILAQKVAVMCQNLAAKGIFIRCVQGLRTKEYQDQLYAEGRTVLKDAQGKPLSKVTNARGGYSYHNFGLAVDLVPGIRGDEAWKPNWTATHPDWKIMIEEGIAQGLVSGSTWKSMPDMPHFQLSGIPVSPTDAMREVLAQAGIPEVWKKFVVTPITPTP